MPTNKPIPEAADLRRRRLETGTTLRDLARSAEVSESYLSKLEHGVYQNPTRDTLKKITRAIERREKAVQSQKAA